MPAPDETDPKPLEVRVLGPLKVHCHGEPVDLGGPIPRRIFATLAINLGRVVTVDRLQEQAWGLYDDRPASADSILKTNISRMRRQLPDNSINYAYTGYVLNADLVQLDSLLFEQLLAKAREHAEAAEFDSVLLAASDALALWRGPVLDGLTILGERLVDEFRLDEERLHAETLRAEALLALGRLDEAVAELARLTQTHLMKEKLWELYMLGLYRSGRPAEALRAFQTLRSSLVNAVGLEPGPALRALEIAVLREDPDLMKSPQGIGYRSVEATQRQLTELAQTAARVRQLEQELLEQAHAAHRAGATWDEIAEATGLEPDEAERRLR